MNKRYLFSQLLLFRIAKLNFIFVSISSIFTLSTRPESTKTLTALRIQNNNHEKNNEQMQKKMEKKN